MHFYKVDLIPRVLKLPFYQTCGIWQICIWYQHLDTLGYGNCKTGLNISSHKNTCNGLLVPRQNLLVKWNKIFEQAYFFFFCPDKVISKELLAKILFQHGVHCPWFGVQSGNWTSGGQKNMVGLKKKPSTADEQ